LRIEAGGDLEKMPGNVNADCLSAVITPRFGCIRFYLLDKLCQKFAAIETFIGIKIEFKPIAGLQNYCLAYPFFGVHLPEHRVPLLAAKGSFFAQLHRAVMKGQVI
jgi:hypothetical protein